MEKLKIIDCGTCVITKSQGIDAIITAINIRFEKVQYEISYFYNGDYKSVWLNENEFEFETKEAKNKIGFK